MTMCENKSTSTPTLETKDWHLLPLPPSSIAEEEQEHIKVGLVEIHPNNTKIVYTSRSRADQSRDVAKELIIVQDISSNHNNAALSSNNPIICSFTLRELIKQLNHFLQEEHQSSLSELTTAEDMMILQGGHIEAVSSLTAPLVGAHLLGAVQDISFLDRNALRCVLPPGLVGDDNDNDERERLLIGFRRCMVVVSVVGLGLRHNDDNNSNKMTIEAYIGPHNVDEYENDTKIQKRQPSSFAIPISEHILAYGCYDGGIRFYDIYKRQQAKACLGPNGRSNPIVKMINANPTTKCTSQQQQRTQLRPRIISACVSANAYLWELNLSIDLPTNEINHFDIPPPIATFDGLVAAVSASGVPVTYPPPLSPTTRAALSPCCSWDQTDLLHEQFRISYDGHGDRLCFVFSPDAIGTSLNPYGTRQERLELNGALVFWNLAFLPSLNTTWPLPPIAPLCVSSLPRTKNGRVTSDFVLPGYHYCCGNEDASSFLITLYATTANEVAAALTSLENGSDCVQKGVNAAFLSDLSVLQLDGSESGFECHSLTFSSSDHTMVAIGTEKGTLLVRVTEDLNATSSSFASSSSSSDCNDTPEKKPIVLDENYRISDDRAIIECREQDERNDAGEQLPLANAADDTDNLCQSPMDEESSQGSPAPAALESPSATSDTNVLKEELRLTLERLEREEEKNKELSSKLAAAEKKAEAIFRSSGLDQSSNQWGDSMKEPRALLEGADDAKKGEVEEQPSRRRRLTVEEADAAISRRLSLSDALSLEESEVTSYNDADDDVSELTGDHIQTMQEENADLRRQVHELIANKDEVSDVSNDGDLFQQVELEKLHQQLSIAKENEQSLREYIELLEQNKDAVEEDLEYARQDAEKNAAMVENLETDVYEQKLALEEMANLLEEERKMRDEVIASMKNEKHKPQSERVDTDEMLYLKEENAQLKEEVALHVAMTTAMKVELQNALNELAELRRQE